MTAFFWSAAAMVVVACSLIVLPLFRKGEEVTAVSQAVARTAMVAVLLILPLAALTLYKVFSNWNWQTPVAQESQQAQPDIAAMVSRLERRLSTDGGTAEDWHMLARSYLVMERVNDAVSAFEKAYDVSGGGSADLKLDFADALLAADPGSVSARAGRLIEAALEQQPTSRKALWYGGSAAYSQGNFAAAVSRWQTLLDGNPPPPDAMRKILDENIAAARAQMGIESNAATSRPSNDNNAAGASSVAVTVTLDPSLAERISPSTPLFIIAREAGAQGGPPVAVKRLNASDLPLEVTLSDADAMLPNRKLSGFDSVEIVARLALGGGPVARPGDLFGSVNYNSGAEPAVSVLIDKVHP